MVDRKESKPLLDSARTKRAVSLDQNIKDASDARSNSVRGIMKRNRESRERQD